MMISTFEEQVTSRRRPAAGTAPRPPRTITRTLIEGTVTEVQSLTADFGQPYPGQQNGLMPAYLIDAGDGQTVLAGDLNRDTRRVKLLMTGITEQPVRAGDQLRIVADQRLVGTGQYIVRDLGWL